MEIAFSSHAFRLVLVSEANEQLPQVATAVVYQLDFIQVVARLSWF
jgi:hypothetical protein